MGEGFGANPLFSLSYFCLKLTDKPEFESVVRVQICGGQGSARPTGYLQHTDKPEFEDARAFGSCVECAKKKETP